MLLAELFSEAGNYQLVILSEYYLEDEMAHSIINGETVYLFKIVATKSRSLIFYTLKEAERSNWVNAITMASGHRNIEHYYDLLVNFNIE